jgi:hypothetical protein
MSKATPDFDIIWFNSLGKVKTIWKYPTGRSFDICD